MLKNLNSKRLGVLLVVLLGAATLFGHYVGASLGMGSPTGSGGPGAYASPPGSSVSARARLDRTSVLEGSDGRVRMELVLEARPGGERRGVRVPSDLVVVLDRSGSMSGDKMEYARAAVHKLLESLEAEDRFALVSYASAVEVRVRLAKASPGARARWRSLVEEIQAGGGTNISQALDRAWDVLAGQQQAGRAARMVLISDGQVNQGDCSIEGLSRRARRVVESEAVLSTVGVGEDFNEAIMSGLADAGTGNYYYLRSSVELASVFAGEFEASRHTVARGVSLTLTPGPGVKVEDAAGYRLERQGRQVSLRLGSLFAGQERRLWITYRVPADGVAEHSLGPVALSWSEAGEAHSVRLTETPLVACVRDEARFFRSVDREAWESAVVMEAYGELQQRVAEHVKKGERAQAVSAIQEYKDATGRMNRAIQSPAVSHNLEEAERLQADVEEAFTGADQAGKQNRFSKTRQAESWDARRAGAKWQN